MIDLSLQRGVWVDPAARTCRAQAGCTLGDVDSETQLHGLATVLGFVSATGVAGLTVGGGFGYLTRKHGWTCDNLISMEVVTAEGKLVRASAEENPDLFWALRGGGGNFGIVTAFEYQLHPVAPEVLGGMAVYTLDRAPDVLRFYRDFAPTLPDEAELHAALLTAPGGPPVVALLAGYNGPIAEGQALFAAIKSLGDPIQDVIGPMPYAVRQTLLDEPNAIHGLQRYWKSGFTGTFSDELIDAAVKAASSFTSPLSAMIFTYLHGAATRVPADATAFGLRSAQWDVNIIGQWADASESPQHIAWAKDNWAAFEPLISSAAYVNHISADDSVEKVRASYGPHLDRLTAVKRQYDPANIFRLNANIAP